MGFILKTIFAFCVVWGGLYAAQHYWLGAMMGQIADNSGLQLTAPAPAFPTMEIDPAKLRLAINPPVTIDTKKYERMAIESGKCVLTVRNMEAGQAVEELELDYDGEPFELSFNARYLLDITDQISGEMAELRFGGPNDPALVMDPGDADVQYILMPLRV